MASAGRIAEENPALLLNFAAAVSVRRHRMGYEWAMNGLRMDYE